MTEPENQEKTGKPKKIKVTWLIAIAGIIIIVAIFTDGFGLASRNSVSGADQVNPQGKGDYITIPLSEISENAKWYTYNVAGVEVRFFVAKAGDGSIKTGFDACDVCYKFKKGYRQEGGDMVCNNCGRRFAISGLGTENKNPGGCWPGYLPNSIVNDNLLIAKSELASGVRRFK